MENSKHIMANIDSSLKELINSIYIVIPSGSETSQGQWFFCSFSITLVLELKVASSKMHTHLYQWEIFPIHSKNSIVWSLTLSHVADFNVHF